MSGDGPCTAAQVAGGDGATWAGWGQTHARGFWVWFPLSAPLSHCHKVEEMDVEPWLYCSLLLGGWRLRSAICVWLSSTRHASEFTLPWFFFGSTGV
jgi:hypothetical protein